MLGERLKEIGYPVISGFALYLAFSKYDLWLLTFPALFLLTSSRSALGWFLGGLSFFFSSLLWIRIAMVDYGGVNPIVAILLIASLSLLLTLYQFSLTHFLWKLSGFKVVLLPPVWTFAEIMRSHFPYGGFPWVLIGEHAVNIPLLRDYLSAGGVYLGTLLLWYISLSPHLLKKPRYALLYLLLFLLPLPFVEREVRTPKRDFKVAIVQTNVPEDVKLRKDLFLGELPRLWRLLEEAVSKNPDLIIFPESAFPFFAGDLYEKGRKLLEASKKAPILVGLVDVRTDGSFIRPYNSVFAISGGDVIDFYDKVRLLPFGEYVPFPFGFVKDIFGAIGGVDYTPGEDLDCVDIEDLRVATPICFEVSYFSLVRKLARCSDIIAVLTNDGWFRDSDGTFQHLRQARVRAAENRRFLIWVNNTGPSAVISPEGKILAEIPYGKEGVLLFTIRSRP